MKPYLKDIIIDLQKSGTWKIQLTIAIKFIISRYQTRLETSIRGSNFTFDSVNLLY